MDIRFIAPELATFDALKSEALCVPMFEDVRPPVGVLGLVDWRLCGWISGLLLRGRVTGRAGEVALIPTRPRLPFEKLFVFGAGAQSAFGDAEFEAVVMQMLEVLSAAKVRAAALVLPGRPEGKITPARAMERFLLAAAACPPHDEILLVDDLEAQRAMEPVVEHERRRARAAVEST